MFGSSHGTFPVCLYGGEQVLIGLRLFFVSFFFWGGGLVAAAAFNLGETSQSSQIKIC